VDKFKVGDKGRWIDYDSGFTFEIKEVTERQYIYDIWRNGKILTQDYKCDTSTVEKEMRKFTKLELALS
jgi:hypothetical protein